MDRKCENCAFWRERNEDMGRCLRYPPTVLPDNKGDGYADIQPMSDKDDFCGEHALPKATLDKLKE